MKTINVFYPRLLNDPGERVFFMPHFAKGEGSFF